LVLLEWAKVKTDPFVSEVFGSPLLYMLFWSGRAR